jgi:hypothetical protein
MDDVRRLAYRREGALSMCFKSRAFLAAYPFWSLSKYR